MRIRGTMAMVSVVMLTTMGCATTGGTAGPVGTAGVSSTTVDFGIVVSDAAKSVAFYQDALGFTEVEGFSVPADMGGDSGLTDHKPFDVRVMVLGEGPTATKVKLIQFSDAPGAKAPNDFIHTTLGVSYLTLFVTDTTAAVAQAAAAGAKPLAKGPVALPAELAEGIYLTLLRDPDGNMIELVGPKKVTERGLG